MLTIISVRLDSKVTGNKTKYLIDKAAVTLIAESPESAESSPMQHVIIEATAT